MNKIKFANMEVEAWKVRAGTVVMWNGFYYHISGFSCNDVLNITDDISEQSTDAVYASDLTWIEPH